MTFRNEEINTNDIQKWRDKDYMLVLPQKKKKMLSWGLQVETKKDTKYNMKKYKSIKCKWKGYSQIYNTQTL